MAQKAKILPAHGGTVKVTGYGFHGAEVRGRVDGDVVVTQKRLFLMSKDDEESMGGKTVPSFEVYFDPDLAAETIISRRKSISVLGSNKSDVKLFVKTKQIRLLDGVAGFKGARWGLYAGGTYDVSLKPVFTKDSGVGLHVENLGIANNNPKFHGGMGGFGAWMYGHKDDVDATEWAIDYDPRNSTGATYDSFMNLIGSKGQSMLSYEEQIKAVASDPNMLSFQPFGTPGAGAPSAGTTQAAFCSKCGKPLAAGAKFCASCGSPVPT